jgi:N-acetylneuraminic acid mutarotase
VSWTDTNGNLWLFGGSGIGSSYSGLLNDLWEFNPSTNEWAWMGGSNIADQLGHYGVKGTAAAANMPGARDAASAWTDSNGNFWLFGGNGYDGEGGEGALNDLWEFNLSTKEWTFVAGSIASSQTGANGVYGTLGVFAAQNTPGGRGGVASWADNSGHFWIFGNGAENDLWEFNPAIREWAWMGGSNTVSELGWVPGVYGTQGTPAPGNVPGTRTTAATWTDGNGNLWLFGGLGYADSSSPFQDFLNDLWKFDPSTNEWTWMSGSSTTPGSDNSEPGVYGTLGTPGAGNVPGGRTVAASWIDKSGNLWLFGGVGDSSPPYTVLEYNDLWEYNPATNEWTWMSGSSTANQLGVYGTEGVLAPANVPGSRQAAPAWTDPNGNFWLFGGTYEPPAGLIVHFNDLWEYEPAEAGAGCTPTASLTPNPLAFGNEQMDSTTAQSSLNLTNSSNCALDNIVISLAGADPSDFAIVPASNACGSSLPASSSCFIYLTFTPQAVGARSATLSVTDNATNSPQMATLTGTGLAIPPAVINIAEVIHTTDTDVATPSTLLNIAEVIHTTDADLATPSTLLNIAEVIHTTDAPVLTPEVMIAVTASGLAYSRVSQTYVGAVTLKNTGSGSVSGPFQILFTGLTPNVTLVNATGTILGNPYITVSAPASLAPGQSVVVNVQFKDPSGATIHFTPQVTEGSI